MDYEILNSDHSRSFPSGDAFLDKSVGGASVAVYLGSGFRPDPKRLAILVELGTESLGFHTGEELGAEGSNVVGFARYRNGNDAPSSLVEIVRQAKTNDDAIDAARKVFENAGLVVAVCSDQAGRIVDRLVRPKYNVALRFLDEGLATQADMDLTCRMGLGYADGPIERVVRGGLEHHYEITKKLFETYGTASYAPARRSIVAAQRQQAK